MSEYIEKEALRQFPIRKDHYDKENGDEHFIFGIEAVLEYAENLPAADVAPVRHGRWAIDEFGHYCTVCREYGPETEGDAEIVDLLKYGTPYCPNCGAKMDLEG